MNEHVQLRQKYLNYPAIQFWGEYSGSMQYYIDDQKHRAFKDAAPQLAIYKPHGESEWITINKISNAAAKQAWQDWCVKHHLLAQQE